jgi:hypothetical protein
VTTGSNYNLTDAITLVETGYPPVTFNLASGVWDVTNIAAGLQSALNSNSPSASTYTVTFNNFTNKLSITSTIAFNFSNVNYNNRTYYGLGFNTQNFMNFSSTSGTSFTFPGVIDLGEKGFILIEIKELPSKNSGGLYTFLVSLSNISIVDNTFFEQYYENRNDMLADNSNSQTLVTQLTVSLRDNFGNPWQNQGGSTQLALRVRYGK